MKDNSTTQALAQLESITGMVKELELARRGDDGEREDNATAAITEDALSIEVRSNWHLVGQESSDAEFNILLCTGGPAVRIIGKLDEHMEPYHPRIEHQDWGTPWTGYPLTAQEEETVLDYCQCFYFGEA